MLIHKMKTFFKEEERAYCNVSGVLALTFRLSQLFGVAPVLFETRRGVRVVRVSPIRCVVVDIAVGLFSACTFALLVLVTNMFHEDTHYSNTSKVSWMLNFVLIMVTTNIAAYGSPTRVEESIRCLNMLQEVKKAIKNMNIESSVNKEKKKLAIFILLCIFGAFVAIFDYFKVIFTFFTFEKADFRSVLYAFSYIAHIMLLLLELQLAFITNEVNETIKMLNKALETVIYPNESTVYFVINSLKSAREEVHRVTSQFSVIFKVLKKLEDAYAPYLVGIVIISFINLVLTPYQFLNYYSGLPPLNILVLEQLSWWVLHLTRFVIIIEPSHSTMSEIENTYMIAGHLILQSTEDEITEELDWFTKFLLLRKTENTPLGIFSLSRSFLLSIIGSVMTYMIIVIEIQCWEDKCHE